jgi:hypothetical protein
MYLTLAKTLIGNDGQARLGRWSGVKKLPFSLQPAAFRRVKTGLRDNA